MPTNHKIGLDKSKIITTSRRYHQRHCLEAWHIKSAHAPSNRCTCNFSVTLIKSLSQSSIKPC